MENSNFSRRLFCFFYEVDLGGEVVAVAVEERAT